MALNKGVLHFWHFAKNAVAFPRMSRSIVTRASSARRRRQDGCDATMGSSSGGLEALGGRRRGGGSLAAHPFRASWALPWARWGLVPSHGSEVVIGRSGRGAGTRSEEHTSELQ